MDTILKVECEGDLRRALLKGTPSFTEIDRAIHEIWPGRSADGAKYMDDEGDACTLKEQTFADFIATSQKAANGNVLRLQLLAVPVEERVDSKDAMSASQVFARPWERVEQGDGADEEALHTVADLTDGHQDMTSTPKAATQGGYPSTDETARDRAGSAGSTEVFPIGTPPHSPRGCVESPPQDATIESTDAEAIALDADSAPQEGSREGVVIEHDVGEKIDIVLAAFDENGDGHLDFAESCALHSAAWGGDLSQDAYNQMCTDEGEDPEVGLGREALMCIYSRCRTLENDFEAARRKFEGTEEQRERAEQQRREASARPISLLLKNPLLAVPFALDATERLRQGVAAHIVGRKR